eukprot:m.6028 g.6028  ORF g.6028 m.6028 type:complete len:230 (+) comp2531_c0_seq1:52-741(+)
MMMNFVKAVGVVGRSVRSLSHNAGVLTVSPTRRLLGNRTGLFATRRNMSSELKSPAESESVLHGLVKPSKPFAELTVAEKVVETTKDAGSVGIVGIGFIAAGLMFASVAKYLLFQETPRSVYEDAVKHLKTREELLEVIGDVSAQSVGAGFNPFSHQSYAVGDTAYLKLAFHVSGTRGEGVVQMEMKKSTKLTGVLSSYKYRYLLVDVVDEVGRKTRLVLEDNRAEDEL